MRHAIAAMAVVAFLAVPACGGDAGPTGPAAFDVSGQWSGQSGSGQFTLTLNEDADGDITGGGSVSGPGGSASLDVSGSHVGENVTLQMSSSGFADLNYSATLDNENRMTGTLNGSGFDGETLVLNR